LLLLTQLLAVVRLLDAPALAVLAGSVTAPLERALVGEAARALQEELGALAPAEPAPCIVIDRHVRFFLRSDAAPLRGAAAIVRDRGHVLDRGDLEARGLQRADRGLAAGAGTLDPHLDTLHAEIDRFAGARLGGDLCGEGRALARALEP